MADDLSRLAKGFHVDTSRPDFVKLGFKDVEWIACGIHFDRGRNDKSDNLHRFVTDGFIIRTTAPFDWLSFFRQWSFECTEVREGQRGYYRLKGPLAPILGPTPCVYLVDDRTLVFDDEKPIRRLATQETQPQPSYLRSEEWRRASRGLLAVAINNENGSFAKQYDLGRADDKTTLSLFRGVEHWVFGVDDAEALSAHAEARCQDLGASERVAGKIEAYLKRCRAAISRAANAKGDVAGGAPEAVSILQEAVSNLNRMETTLLTTTRVEHTAQSIGVHAEGFGTFDDVASVIRAEIADAQARPAVATDAPKSTKR